MNRLVSFYHGNTLTIVRIEYEKQDTVPVLSYPPEILKYGEMDFQLLISVLERSHAIGLYGADLALKSLQTYERSLTSQPVFVQNALRQALTDEDNEITPGFIPNESTVVLGLPTEPEEGPRFIEDDGD